MLATALFAVFVVSLLLSRYWDQITTSREVQSMPRWGWHLALATCLGLVSLIAGSELVPSQGQYDLAFGLPEHAGQWAAVALLFLMVDTTFRVHHGVAPKLVGMPAAAMLLGLATSWPDNAGLFLGVAAAFFGVELIITLLPNEAWRIVGLATIPVFLGATIGWPDDNGQWIVAVGAALVVLFAGEPFDAIRSAVVSALPQSSTSGLGRVSRKAWMAMGAVVIVALGIVVPAVRGWDSVDRWVALAAIVIYAIVFFLRGPRVLLFAVALMAVYLAIGGIPRQREDLVATIVAVLLFMSIGNREQRISDLVLDWIPLPILFYAYDLTRGWADSTDLPLQIAAPIEIDKFFFGGEVPTVWLQDRMGLMENGVETEMAAQWWEGLFATTYVTHFIFPFVLLAGFWFADHDLFLRGRNRFVGLTLAGLATYVLLPTAPPWMAGTDGSFNIGGKVYEFGYIDPVARTTSRGWQYFRLPWAADMIERGQNGDTSNAVAAMPSLHGGYSMFFSLAMWSHAKWFRPLLVAFPFLMMLTLVAGGEHYVTDVVVGWAYAVIFGWGIWRPLKKPGGPADTVATPADQQRADDREDTVNPDGNSSAPNAVADGRTEVDPEAAGHEDELSPRPA